MQLTAKTVESALATIHDPELHGFAEHALREHWRHFGGEGKSKTVALILAIFNLNHFYTGNIEAELFELPI